MTSAIALAGILSALAAALKPLKHPLYVLHILWCGGVTWLLGEVGLMAGEMSKEAVPALLIIHFVVINMITFMAYGFDKYAAQRGGWRIPEKTLHSFILLGGNAGAYCGSRSFRHKTKKTSFRQMALAVNVLQVAIVIALFFIF